jgi:hypothetical protein
MNICISRADYTLTDALISCLVRIILLQLLSALSNSFFRTVCCIQCFV